MISVCIIAYIVAVTMDSRFKVLLSLVVGVKSLFRLSGSISKAGKTYKAEETKVVVIVMLFVRTKTDNHNRYL